MKSRSHKNPWVLLLMGLSLAGLLAWAGVALLGGAREDVTAVESTDEGPQEPANGNDAPRAKALGGLELDREGAKDLEVQVEILGPAKEEAVDRPIAAGRSRLRLESVRVGKRMPFAWTIEAGPGAGREGQSAGVDRLDDLLPGWYLLNLSGPGGAQAPRLVQLHADQETEIRVDWTHAGRVRGRVFGPLGRPVAKAQVRIGKTSAETDAEGRFELAGLWPGSGLPLLIEAEGLASRVEPIGVVASSEPPVELRFVLEEGAEVEGFVDMPRKEYASARLFVLPGRSTGKSRSGRGYAQLPLFWKGRFSNLHLDAQGRFRIRGLSRSVPLALGMVHPRYRLDEPKHLPIQQREGKVVAQVMLKPEAIRSSRAKGRWGEAYFGGGRRPPLASAAARMGVSSTDHHEDEAGDADPSIILRLRFAAVVTAEGKVRALRLHLQQDGVAPAPPVIVDPRVAYELSFARPSRVRVSVRTRGAGAAGFQRELDLRGPRSLDVK